MKLWLLSCKEQNIDLWSCCDDIKYSLVRQTTWLWSYILKILNLTLENGFVVFLKLITELINMVLLQMSISRLFHCLQSFQSPQDWPSQQSFKIKTKKISSRNNCFVIVLLIWTGCWLDRRTRGETSCVPGQNRKLSQRGRSAQERAWKTWTEMHGKYWLKPFCFSATQSNLSLN